MNANPGDCDCERCEIDRERAPYQRAWLTAFREATTAQVSAALDAVESGSHRDSPAAIRALLALTGLMLEQEANSPALWSEGWRVSGPRMSSRPCQQRRRSGASV